jgi:hypothetical protein
VSDVIESSIFVAVRCCDKVSLLTLIASETHSKSADRNSKGKFSKISSGAWL